MTHPSADVRPEHIGDGTDVPQFCVVLPGAAIGRNCNINSCVFIENGVVIGDNVTVKCRVQLWNGLRVGEGASIGPNVAFVNGMNPRSKRYSHSFVQTIVMAGASFGAKATIRAGLRISESAMIGAKGVLTKDTPAHSLWYGSPA